MKKTRKKVSALFWETELINEFRRIYPKYGLEKILELKFDAKFIIILPEDIQSDIGAKDPENEVNVKNKKGNYILNEAFRIIDPLHDLSKDVSGSILAIKIRIDYVRKSKKYALRRLRDKHGRLIKRRFDKKKYTSYKRKVWLKRKDGVYQKYWVRIWRKK